MAFLLLKVYKFSQTTLVLNAFPAILEDFNLKIFRGRISPDPLVDSCSHIRSGPPNCELSAQAPVLLLILFETDFPSGTIKQTLYPDLGSDTSSVWNSFSVLVSQMSLCTEVSDVVMKYNLLAQAWV